jgi:hypothetical protein
MELSELIKRQRNREFIKEYQDSMAAAPRLIAIIVELYRLLDSMALDAQEKERMRGTIDRLTITKSVIEAGLQRYADAFRSATAA